MKEREIYGNIRALPPLIIRLDGRAFHTLSDLLKLEKPYDQTFSIAIAEVAASLVEMSGLAPDLAFTFSDEISLIFLQIPYNGRIEKVDSVAASYAASAFTISMKLKEPVSFDARVIPVTKDLIIEYLIWRQRETWRNHINSWSQHLLMHDGLSSNLAAERLEGLKTGELHELCYSYGINLAKTPAWQRRGILVYKKTVEKNGYNPITKEHTIALRRRVVVDQDIPLFDSPEGQQLIALLCSE